MDWWNRKRVAELEREVCRLKTERDTANEKLIDANKRLNGERIATEYCKTCKHGVKSDLPAFYPYGGNVYIYSCELNCNCIDFEKA